MLSRGPSRFLLRSVQDSRSFTCHRTDVSVILTPIPITLPASPSPKQASAHCVPNTIAPGPIAQTLGVGFNNRAALQLDRLHLGDEPCGIVAQV